MSVQAATLYPGSNPTDQFFFATNSDSTAGAVTLTTAKMINAVWNRNGNGANRTDTTPTAAAIVGVIGPGAVPNSAFLFLVRNTSTANETITITGGTGVTVTNGVVAGGFAKLFFGICTTVSGTAAVSLVGIGGSN